MLSQSKACDPVAEAQGRAFAEYSMCLQGKIRVLDPWQHPNLPWAKPNSLRLCLHKVSMISNRPPKSVLVPMRKGGRRGGGGV